MYQPSVWEKESFFAPADIIIAGSGLTGLWSAYYLKKLAPSLSVTIVDKGLVPTGASTRNAGFACFGSLTELISDARSMGEEAMLQLVEMRYKGIRRIKKFLPNHQIQFEKLGGYELIAPIHRSGADAALNTDVPAAPQDDLSNLDILRSSIDSMNRQLKPITGHQKTFRLSEEKLGEFGFQGISHLIENPYEGQLHSGLLCQVLLREVQSMGVTILNNIEITSYEKVNGHLLLHTNQPFFLQSSQLLVCTNAFAKQLIPQLDIIPARGQVIVTSPVDSLKFKGTFHFDEGFYYFRNLGDRVLLGGARNKAFEEETTTEMNLSDTIQNELEHFLKTTILPDQYYTIDHRWSGIMAFGAEKKPIVKAVNDHVFCAVRFSGMGVALAPIIGEEIARLMTAEQTL